MFYHNMEINKILVPIDFSEASKKALDWACSFAERFKAELLIMHVFELKKSYYEHESIGNNQVLTRDIKDEKIERLKTMIVQKGISKRVSVEYITESGNFHTRLKEAINIHDVDFVVMGTEGAEDWENYLFGSDAVKVLGYCNKLLAVIPAQNGEIKIKKMAFASDFSIEELEPILFMAQLARLFNATINIIHVGINQIEKNETQLLNFKKLIDKNIEGQHIQYHLLMKDNIVDGLKEFTINNQIDILGINHHMADGFFDEVMYPSITKDLEMYQNIPLLVFSS